MGNKAVITTKENFENDGIGIYVHWNGGRDSVEAFLAYCKEKGYRGLTEDPAYGFARLAQVIGNFFGGCYSVGINVVSNLDCDNGDNGVYLVDGWNIIDRVYFHGKEQNVFTLDEMMHAIDEKMPESERICS